ncbi:hypothetical protein P9112_010425 [Eukaryota sp. TZLM1-RC]
MDDQLCVFKQEDWMVVLNLSIDFCFVVQLCYRLDHNILQPYAFLSQQQQQRGNKDIRVAAILHNHIAAEQYLPFYNYQVRFEPRRRHLPL